MRKIDKVVVSESLYILYVSTILSLFIQSVFLLIGKWDYTVLLGNIYGLAAAVGNFFFMGYFVQLSLTKEPDDAKKQIKLSHSMRLLAMFVLAIIAYVVPFLNIIAAVIPYLFPRIAIALRPLLKKD